MKRFRHYLSLSLLPIIFVISSPSAESQFRWEPVASVPESAPDVTILLADSADHLYAFSRSRGLFRSKNNGRSWVALFDTATLRLNDIGVVEGDHLLLGAENGLFRYDPESDELTSLGEGLPSPLRVTDVSLRSEEELFLVGRSGPGREHVYRSLDGGESWKEFGTLSNARSIYHAEEEIYLAVTENEIVRTDTGTAGWQRTHFASDVDVEDIYQVHAARNSSNAYALINAQKAWHDGLYRYSIENDRWYHIFKTHPERPLAFATRKSTELYLATTSGIFYSRDAGKRWDTLLMATDQRSLAETEVLFLHDSYLYAGTWEEMVRIDLESREVEHLRQGFGQGKVSSMAWVAGDILLVTIGHRLYRPSDEGELRWVEVVPEEVAGLEISLGDYHVMSDFRGGALLFGNPAGVRADTLGRLFQTTDGKSWGVADSVIAARGIREVVPMRDRSLMLLTNVSPFPSTAYRYFRSLDGGETWHNVNRTSSPVSIRRVRVAGADSLLLFTTRDGVLSRSENSGEEWSEIDLRSTTVSRASFDGLGLFPDGTALLHRDDTLFISKDEGIAWSPHNLALDDDIPLTFLYDSALVVRGSHTGALQVSYDYGATWSPMVNSGVPDGFLVSDIYTIPDEGITLILENPNVRGVASIYRTIIPRTSVPWRLDGGLDLSLAPEVEVDSDL